MARLGYWLARAVRKVAQDPRVREKASELYENQVKPKATELYENEVKPMAKDAWRKGKPKLEEAKRDFQKAARERNPREELKGFARKVKEQFREGLGEDKDG